MSVADKIFSLFSENSSPKESDWVNSKIAADIEKLPSAFVAAPRFISKNQVDVSVLFEGAKGRTWTLDKLVRVFFLLKIDNSSKDKYTSVIESLFETAEVNEAVALYSSLPFLPYPGYWKFKATEAVRSNIGPVFDALAFGNPYPAEHFSDLEWNQLVLKCIFNDKPIHLIEGLDRRTNRELANSISDFAHERWAAGRTVPAQVWRLVSKFTDEQITNDLQKLFLSVDVSDNYAAALVSHESSFEKAKELLNLYPELSAKVQKGELTWEVLEV